jgi:hypothetical protein
MVHIVYFAVLNCFNEYYGYHVLPFSAIGSGLGSRLRFMYTNRKQKYDSHIHLISKYKMMYHTWSTYRQCDNWSKKKISLMHFSCRILLDLNDSKQWLGCITEMQKRPWFVTVINQLKLNHNIKLNVHSTVNPYNRPAVFTGWDTCVELVSVSWRNLNATSRSVVLSY